MGVNFTQCSSWRILIDNDTIEECGDLYQINEGGWIYRANVCDLRADDLRAIADKLDKLNEIREAIAEKLRN
jgi:hypothetical protein